MSGHKDNVEIKKTLRRQGGIPFFMAFIFFNLLAVLSLVCTQGMLLTQALSAYSEAFLGIVAGLAIGFICYRGYCKSFIHESKHCLAAVIVGNSIKGFSLRNNEGHVTYEFTDSTKRFNAFIHIAPYTIPVLFLPFFFYLIFFTDSNTAAQILIVSALLGFDLYCNLRDVSPVQTDLSSLVGGFATGVFFILAVHIVLIAFFFVWLIHGSVGMVSLLACGWERLITVLLSLLQ